MDGPFVVIGGDAAGMSAASKSKRDDPDLDVLVFEKGEWVAYGACGLPYYVEGRIQSLDDLVSMTPEEFREERNIDLRTGHEVVGIDPEDREVRVDPDAGEAFSQRYGTLLIATGAAATLPRIEGSDHEAVFTLGSLSDGHEIREYVSGLRSGAIEFEDPRGGEACAYFCEHAPRSVGIVGGGYIGIEMAEAFSAHDLEVHLFQRRDRLLRQFDEPVARVVEGHLAEQGVSVHVGAGVERIGETDEGVLAVETGRESVPVDFVLVGAGVEPRAALAEEAGIDLGETGAIATDAYGETSVEGIYAAGDCAEATDVVTGEPTYAPLALTANRHGRAIGRTVAGEPTLVGPIAGTAVLKAFDLEVARTGITDHGRADAAGFDPVTETVETASRSGYYPGGSTITLSLTVDRESESVLGASMVGEEGVAHRINTVVTALFSGMDLAELERLDLAYAPPFSTVWDPILVGAKVTRGRVEDTWPS
ncbi:FAD-dependent oxidoreductase [Natronorarus salvus]|uniref:FAD-dependent oxidoreductase n=1 Tax=Natronorarus salvus TaxID=3117733 RepID=UPI002F2691D3